MTDYKATSEQWDSVRATYERSCNDFNFANNDTAILVSCILELCAKVETLENKVSSQYDYLSERIYDLEYEIRKLNDE